MRKSFFEKVVNEDERSIDIERKYLFPILSCQEDGKDAFFLLKRTIWDFNRHPVGDGIDVKDYLHILKCCPSRVT